MEHGYESILLPVERRKDFPASCLISSSSFTEAVETGISNGTLGKIERSHLIYWVKFSSGQRDPFVAVVTLYFLQNAPK